MEAQKQTDKRILGLEELKEHYPNLFEPIPLRMGHGDDSDGFPNGSVEGWRSLEKDACIEIHESNEPLVNVANLNPPLFSTNDYRAKLDNSSYAPDEYLQGTVLSQYARKTVGEKLEMVQRDLPYGYRLVVFDAWRSLETQMAAYELCFETLMEKLVQQGVIPDERRHNLPDRVKELISRETQNYISLPSPLPESAHPSAEQVAQGKRIPSPHNTGGSVDVAIVRIDESAMPLLEEIEQKLEHETDLTGRAKLRFYLAAVYRFHASMPDYGTEFDYAGQESALVAFEGADHADSEAQAWRRLLYNVMTRVGFLPYAEEWWHYNYGNQMAEATKAKASGKQDAAIYGGIDLTDEQKHYEDLHNIVFDALSQASRGSDDFEVTEGVKKYLSKEDILKLAKIIGDPRLVRGLGSPHDMRYRGDIPDELAQNIRSALDD